MKRWMSTFVVACACVAAQAQYFSTRPGTELDYVTYDEAGQSVLNSTVTVTNVHRQPEKTEVMYFTKRVENRQTNNTSYTLYYWIHEKGKSVCIEDLMYGPYIASDSDPAVYNNEIREALRKDLKWKGDNAFALPDHPHAGESMPDRSWSYQDGGMLRKQVTITGAAYLGNDSVNTTAGNFNCLKVMYLKRTKEMLKNKTLRVAEWYAPGVGLVKSESFDMKGRPAGKVLLVGLREK